MDVVPTLDIVGGIAGLFALRSAGESFPRRRGLGAARVRARPGISCRKDATLGGVSVDEGKPAASLMDASWLRVAPGGDLDRRSRWGPTEGGLVTLYYGGAQPGEDCATSGRRDHAVFPDADVEYYYGGMKNAEYWISLDE